MPTTWRGSDTCSSITAGGAADSSCQRSGSRWPVHPGPANPGYGFCNWFLNNPEGRRIAEASISSTPRSSVTFQGNGVNVVYLDWEHDLVIVVRWIDSNIDLDQFLGMVIGAIDRSQSGAEGYRARPAVG